MPANRLRAVSASHAGRSPWRAVTRNVSSALGLALVHCFAVAAHADTPFGPPPIEVPDGFAVEVAAAPPLVEHPMMAGFDEQGHLYVAENAGVNLNAEELLAEKPNRILRLQDTDGDGRFDRSTVFADKMTFPMGALWHRGALYVASPPYIWRLEDTTGDGVADRREPIVGKFGFVGNAADIHGCFLGPNGRLYWCDGRHGHEFHDEQGNPLSSGKAARIFSCRIDGSDIETYCGGGMDNPVEIAFSPEGEMFGTMTFYNPDEARHDALVHYAYGGVYPRKHAVVAEFKRTGDFMPPLSLFGVVAPAGLTRYRGEHLGPDYRGNLFSVQFNTHKVVRHILTRDGATYRAADEDFLVSSSPDFHPTDVLEDADGSLLVIDTGGWFRNGCPTSQVAKPEILGAIYRIRRTKGPTPADPRGERLEWCRAPTAELVSRLTDRRAAVRDRAIDTLARRGEEPIVALESALATSADPLARRNAVWTLCRIEREPALRAIVTALDDPDAGVRQAAVHSLGTHRYAAATDRLCAMVVEDEPPVRREAAAALGRIGASEAIPALVESIRAGGDRFLEHAAIYALIEIDDYATTVSALRDPNAQVRRAVLIALDQADSGRLTREAVVPLLDTDDVALRQAALEVITRRPGWAEEIVGQLRSWLTATPLTAETAGMLRGALLAFAAEETVQQLIAEQLCDEATPAAARHLLLETVARGPRPLPDLLVEPLGSLLASTDRDLQEHALATVAALEGAQFDESLLALARNDNLPPALRRSALQVVVPRLPQLGDSAFDLLRSGLRDDLPSPQRLALLASLGRAPLNGAQRAELLAQLRDMGPLELPLLLPAFEADGSRELGVELVRALEKSPGLAALSPGRLQALFEHYPGDVQSAAAGLIERLAAEQAEGAARLETLVAQIDGGDTTRGEAVFFSAKAACSACHRVAGRGETIGPDLTKIGEVRTQRDLLEAILLPSASLARGYESYTVANEAGQIFTSVIAHETPAALHLRTAERTELRIPRDEIDEIVPSPVSIMPQGLDRVLRPDELRDLIAYLQSLK